MAYSRRFETQLRPRRKKWVSTSEHFARKMNSPCAIPHNRWERSAAEASKVSFSRIGCSWAAGRPNGLLITLSRDTAAAREWSARSISQTTGTVKTIGSKVLVGWNRLSCGFGVPLRCHVFHWCSKNISPFCFIDLKTIITPQATTLRAELSLVPIAWRAWQFGAYSDKWQFDLRGITGLR